MSSDCFLKAKDGNCGPSRGLCGVVRLSDCNDDIENHLISCHLSKEKLSENQLIFARAGIFNLHQEDTMRMWICYRHRHMLGKFWISTKVTCHYPEHSGVNRSVKGRYVVNLLMAKDIQTLFGVIVPIGSGNFINNVLHEIIVYIAVSRSAS